MPTEIPFKSLYHALVIHFPQPYAKSLPRFPVVTYEFLNQYTASKSLPQTGFQLSPKLPLLKQPPAIVVTRCVPTAWSDDIKLAFIQLHVASGEPWLAERGLGAGSTQRRRCRRRNGCLSGSRADAASLLCLIVPALACLLQAHLAEIKGKGSGSLLLVSSRPNKLLFGGSQ